MEKKRGIVQVSVKKVDITKDLKQLFNHNKKLIKYLATR